jgi:DNA-binding beta-propeller fold protein YncE
MRRVLLPLLALLSTVLTPPLAAAPPKPVTAETAPAVEIVVPGGPLHAIEGMAFGPDGKLYGTSVYDRRIYRIDVATGVVDYPVAAPFGEADDIAFGPAGTAAAGIMAWTAQRSGELRIRRPDGRLEVALAKAPRVNPVAFDDRGRLFVAQSRADDDTLWEIDVTGNQPPRVVSRGRGPLNGFDFAADGTLYSPAFGTDRIVAIDVATGEHKTVASGLGAPAAVKVDRRDSTLVSIDYLRGNLWRSDPRTGGNTLLATFPDVIDNLTLGPDGLIYLPSVADSRVLAFDPRTGATRRVVDGRFTVALGATVTQHAGREALLVADPFGYRYVDPRSGVVTRPAWEGGRGMSSAVAANERIIAWTYAGTPRVRVLDRGSDQLRAEVTSLQAPRGLIVTATDDVIVADAAGGTLNRIRDGLASVIASGLGQPVAVAADGEDAVLVSEFIDGGISRVDLASGQRLRLVSGLRTPSAAARLHDGRIAVVEQQARRVTAIDPASGAREVLATDLPVSLAAFHFAADTPTGLAVTADGNLLVTCAEDNSVRRIVLPHPQHARTAP